MNCNPHRNVTAALITMPSEEYKQPKRTKKYHKGRALVYRRQYDYSIRKSANYQAKVFYSFGAEYGFIAGLQALVSTVDNFNELYQDTLTSKHAFLVLCIKHYVTLHKVESFNPEDLRTFYRLDPVIGYFVNGSRSFRVLFNDLQYMDFCNPHGRSYKPTTRIKVFCTMYERSLKDLLNSPDT